MQALSTVFPAMPDAARLAAAAAEQRFAASVHRGIGDVNTAQDMADAAARADAAGTREAFGATRRHHLRQQLER